jgi:pilus assembly protein FimV
VTDVDLDLDFSLGDEADAATSLSIPDASATHLKTAPRHAAEPTAATPAPFANGLDMNFGNATVTLPTVSPSPAPKPAEAPPEIEFLSGGLDFTSEPFAPPKPVRPSTAAAAPAPAPAPAPADSGLLEFDLGSLSLDLNGPTTESPIHAMTATADDPLETKFQLAEEFRSLGDAEGAKSLAEEVLAKASGPLKVKTQAFLNALS